MKYHLQMPDECGVWQNFGAPRDDAYAVLGMALELREKGVEGPMRIVNSKDFVMMETIELPNGNDSLSVHNTAVLANGQPVQIDHELEEERFVTCILHMPWSNDPEMAMDFGLTEGEKKRLMPQPARSKVARLGERDAAPVNRSARKVVGHNSHDCPYCNKWFRNPAALEIHIEESHDNKGLFEEDKNDG